MTAFSPWRRPLGALVLVASMVVVTAPGEVSAAPAQPSTAAVTSLVTTLMADIAAGTSADQLFYPRNAYLNLKTNQIANPASDYASRLLAFFHLDEAAYRRTIYIEHPGARLIKVEVGASNVGLIPAGSCENNASYFHLPGVRAVFIDAAHTVFSVAINSLITWRNQWYIVHLGPNPRPVNIGTVDRFQLGVARPGPPGGC